MGGGAVQSIETERQLPKINDVTETFLSLVSKSRGQAGPGWPTPLLDGELRHHTQEIDAPLVVLGVDDAELAKDLQALGGLDPGEFPELTGLLNGPKTRKG